MDNKPSSMSLTWNLGDNWWRFKQQFEIFLTASDKDGDSGDDGVKVALLLNFVGEEAIEVFNTFVTLTRRN